MSNEQLTLERNRAFTAAGGHEGPRDLPSDHRIRARVRRGHRPGAADCSWRPVTGTLTAPQTLRTAG